MENVGSEEKVAEASARVSGALDEVKERVRTLNDRAQSYIKENPARSLLGALAIGFLVARLARWRS